MSAFSGHVCSTNSSIDARRLHQKVRRQCPRWKWHNYDSSQDHLSTQALHHDAGVLVNKIELLKVKYVIKIVNYDVTNTYTCSLDCNFNVQENIILLHKIE